MYVVSAADAERIALLDAFGALIANTDRHLGNVSLFHRREGPFDVAPVYDMLPMLFAPREGDVNPCEFRAIASRCLAAAERATLRTR